MGTKFLPEALFQAVITLPFTISFRALPSETFHAPNEWYTTIHSLAVGLFSAGFVLETLADAQLDKPKLNSSGLKQDGVSSVIQTTLAMPLFTPPSHSSCTEAACFTLLPSSVQQQITSTSATSAATVKRRHRSAADTARPAQRSSSSLSGTLRRRIASGPAAKRLRTRGCGGLLVVVLLVCCWRRLSVSTSKEKSSDAAGLRQTKTIMDVYYMR